MLPGCSAQAGSIALSSALAIASIRLPRVRAPERPSHTAVRHETHRRPAALRRCCELFFFAGALMAQLSDRTSARFEGTFALAPVLVIQAPRFVVPRHGPRLVLRSRSSQSERLRIERTEPPFERSFAQVACDRARLRGDAVARHEDKAVPVKPQAQAVGCGGFV
jgi:hypothetical protein